MRHVWLVELRTKSKWDAVWWMSNKKDAMERARIQRAYPNLPSRIGAGVRVVKYTPKRAT